MSLKRLSTMIRRLRKAKGMSQRELAARVGVKGAYIAQLETGARANPSLDVLKRIAKHLGVPVTELTRRGKRMASSGVLFDSGLVYDDGRLTPELIIWTTLRGFGREGATSIELADALRGMGFAKGSPEAVASRVGQMLEEMTSWSAQRRIKRISSERYRALIETEGPQR